MPSATRLLDRGSTLGRRRLFEIADELRERRLALGLSQEVVASAARVSRSRYSRIESAKVDSLTVLETCRLGSVLGLDAAVRLFPGGMPIRDAAHANRLRRLLASARAPLTYRFEVPLPSNGRFEPRAWDAILFGGETRTAIELEMRLRDIQALERRQALKRRDDPTEHFLLVLAGSAANRRILNELENTLMGLSQLRQADVRRALASGRHPGTGWMWV